MVDGIKQADGGGDPAGFAAVAGLVERHAG